MVNTGKDATLKKGGNKTEKPKGDNANEKRPPMKKQADVSKKSAKVSQSQPMSAQAEAEAD